MTLARVRRWRKKLIDSGVSAITVAKAYRLLSAVFNTALDDEMIKRNPCRIKGAERPILSVAQVYALADAVGLRYRALILLAAFTSLRWGELAALTPADIDLDACTVRSPVSLTITGRATGSARPSPRRVFAPSRSLS